MVFINIQLRRRLKDSEHDYPRQIELTEYLAQEFQSHVPEIDPMDIILETTPVREREVADLKGFRFYDSKLGEYEPLTDEIVRLNQYLDTNRRSYIFCKPEYYDKIKDLSRNGGLDEVLGRVIEKVRGERTSSHRGEQL